ANVILQHRSWSESASRAGETRKNGDLPELAECDPVITDFGLALTEHDQSRCTITGTILGTPNYMAPEQAGGKREQQSRPTDVYSLGAMFYELLTGRVPFQGDSPLETMRQVLQVEPVPPARLRPSIPRDLDTICLKCLQKDPQKRYLTARELSDDLHRYLQGEPIHARPVSLVERGWRWCRRHPLDASLAGLLMLAVTAGLIGMSWMWRQAEQGRRSTTQALRQVSDANQQLQRAHGDLVTQRDRGRMLSYLHDVLLAHHECLASNPLRASQLLEDCPTELRNWEWNYLWRLSHAELQSYESHRSSATNVAYSPDGRLLASSSGLWGISVPGELRVAETATGKQLYVAKARLGSIMGLAFSPDGAVLAAAEVSWHPQQAGNVRFFDAATGRELREIAEAGSVFSLSYSPDGRWLALAAADGRVRIVDAATGRIARMLPGHRGNVFHVAFHPDGRRVASASRDGTVRIWDALTGGCLRVLDNMDADARRVAFTPDGRVLIAASHSGLIRLWDLQRDRELTHHRTRPQGISNLGLSPDGRWLAVAYRPSGLEIWDTLSGRHQRSFAAHAGSPSAAAFSPDSTRLASCGVDGTVREWDLTTPIEPETIRVQASFISDVAAIPGTPLLALTSTRNTASGHLGAGDFSCRLWNPVEQRTVRQLEGHQDWLTRVVASSDGRWLATGSNDRTARLWNVADGKCVQVLSGHAATVTALCFLGQDQRLVTGCEDGSMRVWNVADGKLIKSWRAHQGAVSSLVSHSGWIVSAGAEQVRVWDAERGVEHALLAGHSAPVLSVAISRDGQLLATGGADRTVFVWNFSTVTAVPSRAAPWRKLVGHNGPVNDVVFLGDGSRVASVSDDDDVVRLWDLASGQETLRVASLERASVQLAFSNDDHHLYVAGRSHVRIYQTDAPPSSQEKRLQKSQKDPVAWDDQQALAAESDRRWYAAVWHLDRMLISQPEHRAWLQRRARAHAEIGQWQEALEDLQKVGQLSGKPDYWCLAQQALAHVGSGNAREYYRVCQELMARYGSTRDPAMANNVAFVASVLTPPESDLPWLLDLAEFSYVYASQEAGRYTAANTFATILYRAGRYREATDSVLNGIESQGAGGGFSDWLLLAMSYQALGDEAQARRWLEPALRAVREDPDLVSLSAMAAKSPWYDRVLHAVLYQEAVERMDELVPNELRHLAAPQSP
ncbi:MAG: protein kinase, partial [Pirellulaceae bacterium]